MIQRTRSRILISTQHDAGHDLPLAQAKRQGLAALLLRTIKDLPIGQKSRIINCDVRLGGRVAPVWKSKFYGAFVLNRRVDLHAIDATPARWRGDAGSAPLDGASKAAASPTG